MPPLTCFKAQDIRGRLGADLNDGIARRIGRAVQVRTGHAFLKQALPDIGAVHGGEMSAHRYFRDVMACDSGMIPWLLVAERVGRSGKPLVDLLSDRRTTFPSSGKINFRLEDTPAAIADQAPARDETDGLSLTFPDWRLNLINMDVMISSGPISTLSEAQDTRPCTA